MARRVDGSGCGCEMRLRCEGNPIAARHKCMVQRGKTIFRPRLPVKLKNRLFLAPRDQRFPAPARLVSCLKNVCHFGAAYHASPCHLVLCSPQITTLSMCALPIPAPYEPIQPLLGSVHLHYTRIAMSPHNLGPTNSNRMNSALIRLPSDVQANHLAACGVHQRGC